MLPEIQDLQFSCSEGNEGKINSHWHSDERWKNIYYTTQNTTMFKLHISKCIIGILVSDCVITINSTTTTTFNSSFNRSTSEIHLEHSAVL